MQNKMKFSKEFSVMRRSLIEAQLIVLKSTVIKVKFVLHIHR